MSTYYSILGAVKTALDSVSALSTFQRKVRTSAAYLKGVDTLPLCLVCPRRGQWEGIDELHFPDKVWIVYPVLITLIYESTYDTDQLQSLLDARDAIRLALWKPSGITGVSTVFDVDYNPAPGNVDLSALSPQLAVSAQEFIYKSGEARSS